MSRGIWLFILCVAGRTSGQSMFTSKHDYKSMTEFFEVRHRGNIELPPCVKDLLNCWEVVKFQCRETEGYSPFPEESERERFYHYCYDSKQITIERGILAWPACVIRIPSIVVCGEPQ
ncbi:uncharacterized protein LOC134804234 isoform X3 [Cydia splendana]|uniref:uncharacterized protein LOC134804234 isoform X3 n=1 Tax=Cydia splendana TaxID=1100963 RepID=UPI00300C12DA